MAAPKVTLDCGWSRAVLSPFVSQILTMVLALPVGQIARSVARVTIQLNLVGVLDSTGLILRQISPAILLKNLTIQVYVSIKI